jgi:hypothetical protein
MELKFPLELTSFSVHRVKPVSCVAVQMPQVIYNRVTSFPARFLFESMQFLLDGRY